MMKAMKKALSVILVVVIMLTAAPLSGLVGLELPKSLDFSIMSSAATSGTCGDNLTWIFDESTGTLTISGIGEMKSFEARKSPWYTYAEYIKKVVINNGITSIATYAFFGCEELTQVDIPNSVTTIEEGAFFECYKLLNIKIPDSVTSIGRYAFYSCVSLTSIEIPYGVTVIEEQTFDKCQSLTNISIPNSVTSIGTYAFVWCISLKSVRIPDSVTEICDGAFSFCKSLEKVQLSKNLKTIGIGAFSSCSGLTNITIPHGVTAISFGMFGLCINLKYITLPRSVTVIADSAFSSCESLTDVYFCGSEDEWDRIIINNEDDENAVLFSATIHYNSSTHSSCDENGHNYETWVTAPTCTMDGYTTYLCSVCGDSYTSDIISPLGHSIVNGICSICGWNNSGDSYKDYENVTVNYKDKGSITLNFKQEWFKKDSSYYNHDLATLCSQFVTLGYDVNKLESHLKAIGFKNIFWKTEAKENQVDNFIASREISVNGLKFTLLFVGCIGTNTVQWYSNFKPGTSETHASFNDAKNYVYGNIQKYIDDNKIDTSKTKILICGHSRGAATANLLAAQLIDEEKFATKAHIHTYTFATPNPTSSTKAKDSKYSRIFNIVNPEDFVTKVLPAQWKYRRYGTTYVLPSKTNTSNYKNLKSNMQSYFRKLTGDKYTPFKNGEQETYKIVNKFTSTVKSANDFYYKGMRGSIVDNDMKPYEFFQNCICPLVGAEVGSEDFINGLVAFVGVLIDPTTCRTYKEFAQYFFENAVLDRVNTMTPDLLKVVLPIIQPVLGGAVSTVLATSEGYFEDSHRPETYCAYMMSMTASQVTTYRDSYKNTVNCPVDIEVYDKTTGELVGRIVDNVIDEDIASKENSVVMSVDGDSKLFWLPSDGEYDVRLIGNDNGAMDYTVAEVDGDSVETARVNFVDVEITDNKSMSGDFTGKDFALEDYTLTTEEGNTIESDDLITSDNIDEYKFDVTISTIGIGFTTGDGTYTKGDYVTVSASTDEPNEFIGWYQNDKLVSSDKEYSFVVQSDVELTAEFTNYEYQFFIQEPSRTEIRHKDGIKLHAKLEGTAPAGSYVVWTASNSKFKTEEINGGNSLKIVSNSNGKTTFTASLYSADGEILATDTIEMKSKAGFFDKIGSFFRGLFGLTKIYES